MTEPKNYFADSRESAEALAREVITPEQAHHIDEYLTASLAVEHQIEHQGQTWRMIHLGWCGNVCYPKT